MANAIDWSKLVYVRGDNAFSLSLIIVYNVKRKMSTKFLILAYFIAKNTM